MVFRGVFLPSLGIALCAAVLGITTNALRSDDRIEIGRAYFADPPAAGGEGQDADPAAPGPRIAAMDLARRAAAEFSVVDSREMRRLLDAAQLTPTRVVILDARNAASFRKGHLPGAVLMDYYNIREYIRIALPFLRITPWIVVYCESDECEDGLLLCRVLRDAYGIPGDRLSLYLGGFREWRDSGLPVIKGRSTQ